MNAQEKLWAGDFGREYTERNRVEWERRRSCWELMLERTGARSVLEVGANAGWNLLALRAADPTIKLRGVDLNEAAIAEAKRNAFDVRKVRGSDVGTLWPARFDLVFTAGVLIHVAPDNLDITMRSIIAASARHVLAVEYASAQEEAVAYRGAEDQLWKRPFGQLYEEMGLELEVVGELRQGDGFDNCTYWLFRKASE
jgi:pseudaminic acid biosynthesis-associated methylase